MFKLPRNPSLEGLKMFKLPRNPSLEGLRVKCGVTSISAL